LRDTPLTGNGDYLMKCERIDSLLVAYLDGEVTPLEREEIKVHLAGCLACTGELAAMRVMRRQTGATLQAVAATAVPPSQAWSHLQQRLEVHLAARRQQQQKVRTLGATSQDKGEARSPSWFRRLAPGVGRIRQIFQVRGGLTMKKTFALAAIAALIITVSMVAFVPSARAWAQDVLTQFGALIITDSPTWPERVINTPPAPTPVGQPTATPIAGPLPILTIEEASDVAGFQVLSPEYLPAGYRIADRGAYVEEARVFATTSWATEGGEERVYISQVRYVSGHSEEEFPVGDALTMDVTVRGLPGLWVEGAKLGIRSDNRGGSELYGVNFLIWEEGDDLFRLTSDELALAEMLKIAESLE